MNSTDHSIGRRAFLQYGALLGAAALAGPALAKPERSSAARWLRRRRDFALEEITIDQLQEAQASGQYSAVSLARKYLRRIEQLDRQGPALHAVIELNPDALAIAAALDKERKAKGPRGSLHGVPVLIKDNIDTHDRMTTTAGSLALQGSIPPRDAFLVERLREAGAVILGKTNLSEWANYRSTRSTSGWSARGGQTCNPYALDRNPSGSSSGSGVAVSANLCAVAIGTETDGSITSPASSNGIVGFKPTVGLISRAGIIPIAASQDTAGPMTRTVRDAAILLGALTGEDARDSATEASRGKAHRDYTSFLKPDGLQGARLGIAREFFKFHRAVAKLMDTVLEEMRRRGAVLVDPVTLGKAQERGRAENTVLSYEFKAGINAYLASLGPNAPHRNLRDLIEFNERHRDREMPWFGQEEFLESEGRGPLTEPAYLEALATCRRLARDEGIDKVMTEHRLDAIVAPTGQPAWLTDWLTGDHWIGGSTSPAAVAGYPSITVPAGQIAGLPVGISFFGRAWSEPTLLAIAYGFEQAIRARRGPRFLPTANFVGV